MKFFVLLLVLIASAIAVTPACAPASYCKGCSETVATTCTSCYNGNDPKIGPKAMVSPATTCAVAVTAITDCLFYNPSNGQAAVKASTCRFCKNGNVSVDDQLAASAAYTPTCPATLPTGCTKVANCKQSKCVRTFGSTYTVSCAICDSGMGPSASNACAGTIIANCEQAYSSGTTGQTC